MAVTPGQADTWSARCYEHSVSERTIWVPVTLQGHHEMPPYSDGSMRSAYHVRELEAYRLAQVGGAQCQFC